MESLDELLAKVGSRDGTVREWAVYELGELGDPAAIPALTRLLDDEDQWVREKSILALAKLRASGVEEKIKLMRKYETNSRLLHAINHYLAEIQR